MEHLIKKLDVVHSQLVELHMELEKPVLTLTSSSITSSWAKKKAIEQEAILSDFNALKEEIRKAINSTPTNNKEYIELKVLSVELDGIKEELAELKKLWKKIESVLEFTKYYILKSPVS